MVRSELDFDSICLISVLVICGCGAMGFFYNDLIDDEKNFIDKEFTSLWYRV